MRKAKNIILLSGIILILLFVQLKLLVFVKDIISFYPVTNWGYLISGDLSPLLIVSAILILPIILLVRNLKNKTGRVLPIISLTTVGLMGLFMLLCNASVSIPNYLIYTKLSLINTYYAVLLNFFRTGGFLMLLGLIAIVVASAMSIVKTSK